MSDDTVQHSGQPPGPDEAWTIQRILHWSAGWLKERSITETPRLDAELLLSRALGMTRMQLYTSFDKPLSRGERDPFKLMLRRRGDGEPVAYITGSKEFMGIAFDVNSAVLIPRPDTETLVEQVIRIGKTLDRPLRILDIGTGSGCIAISVARALPGARVVAWDKSADALAVAAANARRYDQQAIEFHQIDALDTAAWSGWTGFDFIVSNPPYIADGEEQDLPRSVVGFEPRTALFAGLNGLAFYEVFARQAPAALADGGRLMVETGHNQSERVAGLLQAAGFDAVKVYKDLNRIDRVVEGVWNGRETQT